MMEFSSVLAVAGVYVWMSIVCAVDVTETCLRYRAKAADFSFGPRLGESLRGMLDQAEILIAALVVVTLCVMGRHPFATSNVTFFIPVALVLLQKALVMPTLGARTEKLVQGIKFPRSNDYHSHMLLDIVKITSLLIFSLGLF
jgi:hypothetical protein